MHSYFTKARIVGVGVNFDDYSKQTASRGNSHFVMSGSELIDFAECPHRWVQGYEGKDTAATEWGTLVDLYLLQKDLFNKRSVAQPRVYPAPKTHKLVKSGEIKEGELLPWNNRASYCKEWNDQNDGKIVVTHSDYRDLVASERAIIDDPIAISLIGVTAKLQVHVEGVTPSGITVRGLIDIVPDDPNTLCDLKTARSVNPRLFKRQVEQNKYYLKAALYLDLWNAATGESRNTFVFIAQENFAPFETLPQILSQEFIEIGRAEYRAALRNYELCLQSNTWPSYPTDKAIDGMPLIEPDQYTLKNA